MRRIEGGQSHPSSHREREKDSERGGLYFIVERAPDCGLNSGVNFKICYRGGQRSSGNGKGIRLEPQKSLFFDNKPRRYTRDCKICAACVRIVYDTEVHARGSHLGTNSHKIEKMCQKKTFEKVRSQEHHSMQSELLRSLQRENTAAGREPQ